MPILGAYNHIHLISPDPKAAADWYVRCLGAKVFADEELRGSRNIRMKLADANLYIRSIRPTDRIVDTNGAKPCGIDHFCFTVEGLEAMLAHAVENGGEVAEPIFTLPSGNRAAYLRGPDGVLIEFIEPKKG